VALIMSSVYAAPVLRSTFQLAAGLGATREKRLWSSGVARWEDYDGQARLPAPLDRALRCALAMAQEAHAAGDVARLAALVPACEHWRLLGELGSTAAYLDIETSDDAVGFAGISAIGLLDARGPRILLAERDLHLFPELTCAWQLLVTFNGGAYDVPILRRAFPGWQPPPVHVDLRHVLPRLGQRGTLKHVERSIAPLHLARPPHLAELDGIGAAGLYRRGRAGDRAAWRRFAEYNLYDVIGLRTLAAYAHNTLSERLVERAPALRAAFSPLPVPGRGDVLYDVSKILLEL
jgi:uncharacterized protein YprB with RNaseH-like and TPR domain